MYTFQRKVQSRIFKRQTINISIAYPKKTLFYIYYYRLLTQLAVIRFKLIVKIKILLIQSCTILHLPGANIYI